MPEIIIEKLGFRYRETGTSVLSHMNLTVKNGEFLCVIGPSGCGKSTLLRLIAGLEQPEEGSICIDGRPIAGPGTDRMIVFQDYALFPWMTALKNVSFAIGQSKGKSRRQAIDEAEDMLRRVGLAEAADKYPFQLSGGMRQRVAIARALAMDTEILLMDEPFGALDARNREQLQKMLLKLRQDRKEKKTVVFVTHDIREAMLLADRVVFLENGAVSHGLSLDAQRPRDERRERELYNIMLDWFGPEWEKEEDEN